MEMANLDTQNNASGHRQDTIHDANERLSRDKAEISHALKFKCIHLL